MEHIEAGGGGFSVFAIRVRRGGIDEWEDAVELRDGRRRCNGVSFVSRWMQDPSKVPHRGTWEDALGVGPAKPTWFASGNAGSGAVMVWPAGGN